MTASNDWTPSLRYPDPAIRSLDPRFDKYRVMLTNVERLTTGLRWAEGPVWFGDGRYLLCSDIPNQRILKWEEETGNVSIFRKPSNFANGNTRDRQGRLVTCEHGGRRVTRTEYDGSITVSVPSYSVRTTRRPLCSQVTRRPSRSRVLPLARPEGCRKTLVAPVCSSQRRMRLLGISLHSTQR